MKALRILMLGDIVGRPGRTVCRRRMHAWRSENDVDLVIANGENASGGNGLTVRNAEDLFNSGIDLITGGNHIWKQKDYPELFKRFSRVIRPANYPPELPGAGWAIVQVNQQAEVAVLNLQGQVFMEPIDSPFRTADRLLEEIRARTPVVLVDFHAEATSERVAMGRHLEGRVSAVVGTHTHVPSSDSTILKGGTAYRTDLGMVGPTDGILGVETEAILKRFLTGLPTRFSVAGGRIIATGSIITVDPSNGRSLNIESFEELFDPRVEEGDVDDSA